MPSVPREKYPEMDWRAADKVAAWKLFKWHMKVIFVADQVPEERQYALILVAGGDKAYNCWDTLEDPMEDPKKVDQVWDAFKKSCEQSTSFWHFRDAYLVDFRQDPSESTADLDLRIKQPVRGCQWKKESEEEWMIDLLYHSTICYEIHKYIQESEPAALTYEMVMEKAKAHERNVLEYKDHQASHRGANNAPSYNNPLLTAHALTKRRPSGQNVCHVLANLIREATTPHMGRPVINARVLIISKPFVIQRLLQPRQCLAPSEARSHSCHRDMVLLGATTEVMANDKGKLSGSREAPIYHEPGTLSCKTIEDLKKLYPNSFDRLGSLKESTTSEWTLQ